MKKCSFCAEEIQDEAIKCKHCGELLGKQERPANQVTPTSFEEKTVKEISPALINYLGVFIIGFILLFFYWWLGLIFIIGALIHRNSVKYTITNKKIRTKNGILSRKIDEIDITHIRNISLRQDFSGKIFGYGNVLISTAGMSDYEIIIGGIDKPQEILTLIKNLQSNARN